MNGRIGGSAGGFDGVPVRARFTRCVVMMAKRGIIDHPKTLGLAASLELDECFAVGILESLFQWVSKHRFTGELTGAKPKAVAAAIRYRGDAEALWSALVENGWIDVLEDGRVGVHDWHDHADNVTRQCLHDAGRVFWNGFPPRKERAGRPSRSDDLETPVKLQSNSSLTPQPEPEPEPEPEPRRSSLRSERRAATSSRGSRRCPVDFELTDERLAVAAAEGLTERQAQREFATMRDYEFKAPRTDWEATWRNWVRKAADRISAGPRASPPPNLTAAGRTVHNVRNMLENP